MNTRMMRDSFKYLEGIINIWNAFGGMKVISKVSWKRNNEKNWQLIESSIFKWLLMMLVSKYVIYSLLLKLFIWFLVSPTRISTR